LDAFLNLTRRKSRTLLAIAGVAVGVFTFLIMGSMAEHFQRISLQFEKLFENRIFICERISFWAGGGILSHAKVGKVEKIEGIKEAIPVLISRWSDKRMVVVGIPRVVLGIPRDKIKILIGGLRPYKGEIALPDRQSAVLGFDIANENNLHVGNEIEIREKPFKVTGILEKTGGLYDGQIFVELGAAQELYHRPGLITSIFILPKQGIDPEKLAKIIKNRINAVEVIPPSMIKAQIRSSLSIWNGLTLGAALAATVTGALCVIITMLVSVSERFIEIGLKRAIGATTGQIMLEFLLEAMAITISGWILGGFLGFIFIEIVTVWLRSLGSNLFDLTPRLYILALVGVVSLGFLSGLYPAYRASVIEPVEALKVKY